MNKELFKEVKCNLCNSNTFTVLSKSKYKKNIKKDDLIKTFSSSGDEVLMDQLVRCNKCGLIYINPRIKTDLILEGYSEGSDETFVSQAKGRELTFEKNLKFIEKFAKPGKILDVGTAGGSFLAVAKKEGGMYMVWNLINGAVNGVENIMVLILRQELFLM